MTFEGEAHAHLAPRPYFAELTQPRKSPNGVAVKQSFWVGPRGRYNIWKTVFHLES